MCYVLPTVILRSVNHQLLFPQWTPNSWVVAMPSNLLNRYPTSSPWFHIWGEGRSGGGRGELKASKHQYYHLWDGRASHKTNNRMSVLKWMQALHFIVKCFLSLFFLNVLSDNECLSQIYIYSYLWWSTVHKKPDGYLGIPSLVMRVCSFCTTYNTWLLDTRHWVQSGHMPASVMCVLCNRIPVKSLCFT